MSGHGEVFWNELMTDDPDSAKDFYAAVMGWEILDGPMPNGEGRYILAKKGEENICGIFPNQGDQAQPSANRWMTYISVDNIDDVVAKVSEHGGQVMMPPFDLPGIGKFSMIKDPTGAELGLAEPHMATEN